MNAISNTQIIDRLVEAQDRFEAAAKGTMQAAFEIGEILTELKAVTPHGKFEDALKTEARFRFTTRHARTFMRIFENKAQIIANSNGKSLSIREMERLLTKPKQDTPEPAPATAPAPASTSDDETIDRLLIDPSPDLGKADDDVIEGEFVAVEPSAPSTPGIPAAPSLEEPEIEPDLIEQESDSPVDERADYSEIDHLKEIINDLARENEQMRIIFEDNNHIEAAIREIERLTSFNQSLDNRINSLVAEVADLKGKLNYWESRCKKLEKSHAK